MNDRETTLWLIKPDTCTISKMRSVFLDRNTVSSLSNVHGAKSKLFGVNIGAMVSLFAHSFEGTDLKDTKIKANSPYQENMLA